MNNLLLHSTHMAFSKILIVHLWLDLSFVFVLYFLPGVMSLLHMAKGHVEDQTNCFEEMQFGQGCHLVELLISREYLVVTWFGIWRAREIRRYLKLLK